MLPWERAFYEITRVAPLLQAAQLSPKLRSQAIELLDKGELIAKMAGLNSPGS
jgi:hypothetical protein